MKHGVGTRAKRCGAVAALSLVLVAASSAAGADRTGMGTAPALLEPNVRRGFKPAVVLKIRLGFHLAMTRAGTVPQCGALFLDLGASPVELLGRSRYFPAALNRGNPSCANRELAFAHFGSPVVWVCDAFKDLSAEEAAMALIHEALHSAGLWEQPHDPQAMTSREIDHLVKSRCTH